KMPRCSAYKCSNSTDSFPLREPRRLKQWVDQMRWKAWKPTRHSRVCAEHFEEKYLITSGQGVRLSPDAIPTIFSFPSEFQKKVNMLIDSTMNIGSNSAGLKETHSYLDHSIWHPSRFHDDYCVPQIKEKWEWLSMEVKGPFRETEIGHTFVLTVMDYYSKWVEAYPMKTTSSKEIAKIISDLISRFGFPVGILSYLSITLIVEVRQTVVIHNRYFCCQEHPTTGQTPLSLLRCGGTPSVSISPRRPTVSWRLQSNLVS
uniref:THAP-type domain-containing protein n=1 Tax=Esox lucius TaxID=8010 RepID=A0A3P8Z098_ESOLU